MSEPKLRIRASGMGGSGYAIPTRTPEGETRTDKKSKFLKVPGVTTAIGALEKGGVTQWAVDHTAAFAVANASALAERDTDWGFKFLRFYHSRKPDFDDPLVDLHNYHAGVLSDLANQGTLIHEAIEAFVKEEFGPSFTRPEQEEAFEAFLDWADVNDVEFLESETTVLHPEGFYAGTFDLDIRYRDKVYRTDIKTSRKVHDSHIYQAAALFKAPIKLVEDPSGVEYKGDTWVERPAGDPDGAAILQVRPRTIDEYGNEVPAFVNFQEIPEWELEAAYDVFLASVAVRKGQLALKQARKENEDYF